MIRTLFPLDRSSSLAIPLHVAFCGATLLVTLMAIGLQVYEPASSHHAIALATGVAVGLLVLYARYVLDLPWLSASVIYLTLFWFFHYGLSFTAVVIPDVLERFEYFQIAWMYWPNVRLAMLLGVVGAAGFVLGVGLVTLRGASSDVPAEAPGDPVLYAAGWVLMVCGIVASLVALRNVGGLGVFDQSFYAILENAENTSLSRFIDLSKLGCLLAICGAARRQWIRPFGVWALFGALLLVLGMRYKVLVPLVCFAVVLTHRGVRLPRAVIGAALVGVLVVVPIIRIVRTVGFGNRALVNWTDVSPLETFTELGGTLRAAKAYVDWIAEGDEYLLGSSYWAPFDRHFLGRLLPGYAVVPFDEDVRVPSRQMWREGRVGTSATGEAYYNFGPIGPFLFFGVIGLLIGWLERRASGNPYHAAQLGVMMLLLFFNIRGEWLPLPIQITFGTVLLASCYVVSQFVQSHPVSRRTMASVS